ncbi:MAG TPA: DinB family protein [Terriglobia bacterium]|nr:DinB family protein [Terriglobia bacterium]
MKEIAQKLEKVIDQAAHKMFDISESDSELRPAPGKWSKKEIIGHLIDSASNNHQRFVRAQENSSISLPGYTQDFWVERQRYQSEPWKTLVALWTTYNTHLAHVIAQVPQDCENNLCTIGSGQPVTLRGLAEDYIKHAGHHLEQICGSRP